MPDLHKTISTSGIFHLVLSLLAVRQAQNAGTRPHIVFLLADDLGWDDVSFHGSSQIPTPNLDALAADGIILNSHYVLPLCTTSRAALMTGLYPIRTGYPLDCVKLHRDVDKYAVSMLTYNKKIRDVMREFSALRDGAGFMAKARLQVPQNIVGPEENYGMQGIAIIPGEPWGLPTDVRTMPQYLKDLGYETHIIGKWHLGGHTESVTPTCRGFDSFYGYLSGEEDYYSRDLTYENHTGLDFWVDKVPVRLEAGTYSTELYTERAQHVIRNHKTSKPLFLLMSYQAVHATGGVEPLQAPKKNVNKFPYIGERNRTIYAGMLDAMDQSVGRVFQALGNAGMLENTVIVFSSDNGGAPWGAFSSRGINWPLRGAKSTIWEGGTRAAAFIWSPLLAWRRRVSTQLMHITDWLPTFYSVAGGNSSKLVGLDGHDMWRQLAHGLRSPRVEMLYNYDDAFTKSAALRNSRYKLVLNGTRSLNDRYPVPGGRRPYQDLDKLLDKSTTADVLRKLYQRNRLPLSRGWRRKATLTCGRGNKQNFSTNSSVYLFDIVADPCELNNLAGSLPNVVASLKERLDLYGAAARPVRNKQADPAGYPENNHGIWAPWLPPFHCKI